MSEKVQEKLDRMLPALADWEERGIFTSDEIQCIVGERRQYEYLLQRRTIRQYDFIQYIQYESNLESLRALRTKRIAKEKKHNNNNNKRKKDNNNNSKQQQDTRTIGDYHIVSNLHSLYGRLLYKYKDDIEMYLLYIKFCKEQKSYNKLSECYGQAIVHHPHNSNIWIDSASHEYFTCNNISTARIILQRAIRINPTQIDLWVQYFILELHFATKMIGRKTILSNNKTTLLQQQDDDDNGKQSKKKMKKQQGDNEINDAKTTTTSTDKKNDETSILEKYHTIAKIVYDNAISSLSNGNVTTDESKSDDTTTTTTTSVFGRRTEEEVAAESRINNYNNNNKQTTTNKESSLTNTGIEIRIQFINACTQFPMTKQLQQYIVQSIQNDFSQISPEVWIMKAMAILTTSSTTTTTQEEEIEEEEEVMVVQKAEKVPAAAKGKKGDDDDDNEDGNDEETTLSMISSNISSSRNNTSTSIIKSVLDTIRTGCSTVQTADMYIQGIQFLHTYMVTVSKENKILFCTTINKLYKSINTTTQYNYFNSTDLLLQHIQHLQYYQLFTTDTVTTKNNDIDNEDDDDELTPRLLLEQYIATVEKRNDNCKSTTSSSSLSSSTSALVNNSNKVIVPPLLWMKLVYYIYLDDYVLRNVTVSYTNAVIALQRGLKSYTVDDTNYIVLLVQYISMCIHVLESDRTDVEPTTLLTQPIFDSIDELCILGSGFIQNTNQCTVLESTLKDIRSTFYDEDDNSNKAHADFCSCIVSTISMVLYNTLSRMIQRKQRCAEQHLAHQQLRLFYEKILFNSTIIDSLLHSNNTKSHIITIRDVIEICIGIEKRYQPDNNNNNVQSKKKLVVAISRLYDYAIKIFGKINQKNYVKGFRYQRNNDVLYSNPTKKEKIKKEKKSDASVTCNKSFLSLNCKSHSFSAKECLKVYRKYQVVHICNDIHNTNVAGIGDTTSTDVLKWDTIGKVFETITNDDDKASWCVETNGTTNNESISATQFLSSNNTSIQRGYCSFILQKDTTVTSDVLQRLPLQHFSWDETKDWTYQNAIWIFFGRNPIGNENLNGRPEHTDSVSHDGTWHYQLSGRKKWYIRPTEELISLLEGTVDDDDDDDSYDDEDHIIRANEIIEIDCNDSDILIINTRLWFHQTIIPPQGVPSVSYARDFHMTDEADDTIPMKDDKSGDMSNVDGLFATSTIDVNTIIFREDYMPDCELHTSEDPNCAVVELDDGTQGVVSIRKITSGEFFTVKEDSSDDSDDEEGSDEGDCCEEEDGEDENEEEDDDDDVEDDDE